jgi:homocysteine S-methyltransferase
MPMSEFLSALRSQTLLTDGAMGSYLFALTGRLSEANHVYECFNADRPDLIEQVHLAYLAAGAQCLVTNTFGANRVRLAELGLAHRCLELNRAGVQVARRAIATYRSHRPQAEPCYVLGSVGPSLRGSFDAAAVDTAYREQIEALVSAGVDAIAIETIDSIELIESIIDLVRRIPGSPPIIAEMTVRPPGAGNAVVEPLEFIQRMKTRAVPVVGVNCCAPWDALAFVDAIAGSAPVMSGELLLVVRPNGGGFQRIGNRFMTMVNPEYAGRLARELLDRGVRLIGGCCEMHPPHLGEMRAYLRSRAAGAVSGQEMPGPAFHAAGDSEKRANGPFSRKLKDGEFVVSVEMLPPRGTDPAAVDTKLRFISELAASGLADALDLTDGSRGIPLMPPADFIQLLRARLGWSEASGDALELIPHFTGRDVNTIGVQGRLIGYHANRVRNVLFVTGDPPKMAPGYPRSSAVFDLDSVEMIRLTARCLNAGVDFGGAPLGKHDDPRTCFTVGTGFEPESLDMKREIERLSRKIDSGADYIMTQPAFRPEPLEVLESVRSRVSVLVGVLLLSNFEQARRLAQVPGVVIPDAVLARLEGFALPDDQAKAGVDIAVEQIRSLIRAGWPGLYLMSPASHRRVIEVLRNGLSELCSTETSRRPQ